MLALSVLSTQIKISDSGASLNELNTKASCTNIMLNHRGTVWVPI